MLSSPADLKKLIKIIAQTPDFAFIDRIGQKLPQARIYLVGGIIRDHLLGRPSKDFDFVASRVSAEDLTQTLEALGQVEFVGQHFGVYKFIPAKNTLRQAIDIALPRTEISTGPKYQDFKVASDPNLPIEDDLSRRDLTINAMAFDLFAGELIDPYGGQKDLRDKIIRVVGSPEKRFTEDYSRILRALRFSAQLNFSFDPASWQAIKKYAPRIIKSELTAPSRQIVPYEVIGQEFAKAVDANPIKTFDLYDQSGLTDLLLPELAACRGVAQPPEFHGEGDVWVHTRLAVSCLKPVHSLGLKMAVLFHDIGKPPTQKMPAETGTRIRFDEHDVVGADLATKICRRFRYAEKFSEYVSWLIQYHLVFIHGRIEDMKPKTIKKYFLDHPQRGNDLLLLYHFDSLASQADQTKSQKIARLEEIKDHIANIRRAYAEAKTTSFRHLINGQEVMSQFNLQPGPAVGLYLELADYYILKYITSHKKEPNKKQIQSYLEQSPYLK